MLTPIEYELNISGQEKQKFRFFETQNTGSWRFSKRPNSFPHRNGSIIKPLRFVHGHGELHVTVTPWQTN